MTASMYTLLLLTLILANLPFLTQRAFGFIALSKKGIGSHLLELSAGFLLTAVLAYVLEQRTGSIHAQGWQFYAAVVCLYLVAAFPAFVWRYFWHGRNKE
ncbi:DUF2818 family protein [Kingella kingae]|uniref:DUF2818 family protein n=1 Tax=Kingella kingae TaxID=504 RepID=UPI0004062094|nr:DUF2818 family protein [Kingella kingae]